MFKNLIRGGQTHIHGVRMAVQIVRFALLGSLLIGIGTFAWKSHLRISSYAWQQCLEYYVAEFQTSLFAETKNTVTQTYYPMNGNKPYQMLSIKVLNDSRVKRVVQYVENVLIKCGAEAATTSGIAFCIIIGFWLIKGTFGKKKEHKRGTTYLSPFRLRWKLILSGNASHFKLGNLPLVKNSETSHILVVGTTGSGKSNCFNLLMPQIRQKGQRAVVFDPTGEFVSKYFVRDKDHLLNPFDARSHDWNIWSEYEHDFQLEAIAKAFIQPAFSNDPFWSEAARNLFIEAIKLFKKQEKYDNYALTKFLLNEDIKTLRSELQDSSVRSLLEEGGEKTLLSVRSTLLNYIKPLEYLQTNNNIFSIKKWIENDDDDSWLFLSCKADQRDALKPLITAWLDISINALMSTKIDPERRFWYIIDELPALQKIPTLKTALAESRKYGGCILAGMQSLNQMHGIYGADSAKAMLNLFNTEIYFRTIESSNRELISQSLGEAEETELVESISYGANTMRDGVSNSLHTRNRRLITATELRHLRSLEAIIQLPAVSSITRLTMPFANVKGQEIAFVTKDVIESKSYQYKSMNLQDEQHEKIIIEEKHIISELEPTE